MTESSGSGVYNENIQHDTYSWLEDDPIGDLTLQVTETERGWGGPARGDRFRHDGHANRLLSIDTVWTLQYLEDEITQEEYSTKSLDTKGANR